MPERLVIRQVRLPQGDGLGDPCDVVVDAGRIAEVRPSSPSRPGEQWLDGAGRVCLPGLVDAHCHAAAAVFEPAVQLALLRQGVTTVVVGQDGIGPAPSDEASHRWSGEYFASLDGESPRLRPGSMARWLGSYDGAVPVNVGAFVPHGSLRYLACGAAQRPSTSGEIADIARLLAQGLDDGALGLSTGLEYVPAAWATRDELVALLGVVAKYGRVHSSHMRGYEAAAPEAVAELVDLAQTTGAATHIAHYHGDAAMLGGLLDRGHEVGVDLTFDSYDYLRGCSLLAMVALPRWLPLADAAATLALLSRPSGVPLRLLDHLAGLDDLWPRTRLAWADGADPVTGEALGWTSGLTVPEVAGRWCVTPAEAALRLLVGTRLGASCVFEQPPTNSAASVEALADREEHMAGSDAVYVPFSGEGLVHPRAWGATARWLAEKVVRQEMWTWGDAVQHLSARAVRRFGLGARGRIEAGAVADIVLAEPSQLRDRATYEAPRLLATGIDDVLVAGLPVLAGGELTGQTPGRGLRWEG